MGGIYIVLNKYELARKHYESAIDKYYDYCKFKSLKIKRGVENRLKIKLRKLNLTHERDYEEIELDDGEETDKFNFGNKQDVVSVGPSQLTEIHQNILKSQNNKLNLENKCETFTSEKVQNESNAARNDLNSKTSSESLELISNYKASLERKLSETSLLETKTFMSDEIIEEIDSHKNLASVFKEALHKRNDESINTELEMNKKQSVEIAPSEDFSHKEKLEFREETNDLNSTAESNRILQENYKKILWEKEKRDEERANFEKDQQNQNLDETTTTPKDASYHSAGTTMFDISKKFMPDVNALNNLDKITTETTQDSAEVVTKSNTFTIK